MKSSKKLAALICAAAIISFGCLGTAMAQKAEGEPSDHNAPAVAHPKGGGGMTMHHGMNMHHHHMMMHHHAMMMHHHRHHHMAMHPKPREIASMFQQALRLADLMGDDAATQLTTLYNGQEAAVAV